MTMESLYPDEPKVCTVSELTEQIKRLLADGFPYVWVSGEVANAKAHGSGHVYFSLKDGKAQIKAVLWRSKALRFGRWVRDGQEVLARGTLDVYAPHGEYKLVIEEIEPRGAGVQDLALRRLKEKLARLGYFAPERKRSLPRFPSHLALITSPTGAAVRDMLEVLARRWPAAQIWVCPVRVQGADAPRDIVAAMELVNLLGHIDVLILGRGGGSAEDLAAFNHERVARAIFESRVPVVSAVGHEIDVTIADLVADRRALTPSEAAELVTPDRVQLLHGFQTCHDRLRKLLDRRLDGVRQRLQELRGRRALAQPLDAIRDREQRLDGLEDRMNRAARRQLVEACQRLDANAARLAALSPLNVLARGYSLTRRERDQRVVRSAEQVQAGDRLVTLVERGRIVSRVEECELTK